MSNEFEFKLKDLEIEKKSLDTLNKLEKTMSSMKDVANKGGLLMKDYEKEMQLLKEKFALDEDNIALASEEQRKRSEFLVRSRKEIEMMKQRNWMERNLIRNMDRFTNQLSEGNLLGATVDLTKMFFKMAADRAGEKEEPLDPASPAMPNTGGGGKQMGMLTRALDKTKFGRSLNRLKGKMGETMGSKKGIMMIGGFAGAGAGIVGTIIQKALEASPIAQAMLKMMSTAFTLILRPIGDFFGGFLKPISIRLLKWGAENVKNGNGMFKAGQEVAAHLIAFFSNPLTYFVAAGLTIVDSIHAFMSNMFLPVVRWFDEDAQAFKPTNYLDAYVNNFRSDLAGFEGMVTEATTQVRSGVTTEMLKDTDIIGGKLDELITIAEEQLEEMTPSDETAGTLPEQPEITQPETIKPDKMADWFEHISGHKGTMTPAIYEAYLGSFNQKQQSAHFKGGNVQGETIEEVRANTEDRKEGDKALKESYEHMQAWNDRHNEILNSDIEVKRKELEEHNARLLKVRQNENAARLNMQEEWLAGELTIVEHMNQQKMIQLSNEEFMAKLSVETGKSSKVMKTQEVKFEWDILKMTKGLFDFAAKIYKDAVNSLNQLKAAQAAAARSRRRSRRSRAVGGMINEPVEGVGLWTGDTWTFGEHGNEWVTPMRGGSSNTNNSYDQKSNITINVNVDKMTSDLDMMKLKPVIERAIRETHSRRGII